MASGTTFTTNVPQPQFTPQGLVIPTAAAVLAGAQADMNQIFGTTLNFSNASTPQSQLAASYTANIMNAYAALLFMVNNINPNTSSGFMQDAIGQIYFNPRNPGAPTVVQCTCTGLTQTQIPTGAQATDTSGNLYTCTQGGTIPNSGSIVLPFANVVDGPIPCPAGTLTQIYQQIPGWDSITNVDDGVLGTNAETSTAYALRLQQSVAIRSQGALQSIYGAVASLPGVIDLYCYENDTSAAITVGSTSYSIAANSIYVGVAGGVAADIAQAIYTKKSPGCGMVGNTSVTVQDTSGGYTAPVPSYTIKFNTLTDTSVYFAVTVTGSNLPANIATLVQNAIIAQFTGQLTVAQGQTVPPRARVGSTIVANDYVTAITASYTGVSVLSIFVGLAASPTGTSVTMGIDQEPTIAAGNITVATS